DRVLGPAGLHAAAHHGGPVDRAHRRRLARGLLRGVRPRRHLVCPRRDLDRHGRRRDRPAPPARPGGTGRPRRPPRRAPAVPPPRLRPRPARSPRPTPAAPFDEEHRMTDPATIRRAVNGVLMPGFNGTGVPGWLARTEGLA